MELQLNAREASLVKAFRRLPAETAAEFSALVQRLAALSATGTIATDPEVAMGQRHVDSAYEAAAQLGIVGALKNAPLDLSTNPGYMDGFGEAPCSPVAAVQDLPKSAPDSHNDPDRQQSA